MFTSRANCEQAKPTIRHEDVLKICVSNNIQISKSKSSITNIMRSSNFSIICMFIIDANENVYLFELWL